MSKESQIAARAWANSARTRAKVPKTLEARLLTATKGMDEAHSAAVRQRALEMPKTHVKTYLRALGGKSLRAAVNAFCAECAGWNRSEIRHCTGVACPLWPYRPFKKPPKGKET